LFSLTDYYEIFDNKGVLSDEITHETKSGRLPYDKRFLRLFQAVVDNEEVAALHNTLNYLYQEQYNANVVTVRRFFYRYL
jgi:hypothetical protein